MRRKQRINKRHAILLEVLIAFTLVVLCALPLMYSHAFLLKEQQEFIQKIRLDHAVNLLYAHLHERLQNNEIPWEAIADKTEFPVEQSLLKKLNKDKALPFQGVYHFEIERRKPPGKKEHPFTLNLLKLTIVFTSSSSSKPYQYEYLVFAGRRLGQQQAVDTADDTDADGANPPSAPTPSGKQVKPLSAALGGKK